MRFRWRVQLKESGWRGWVVGVRVGGRGTASRISPGHRCENADWIAVRVLWADVDE